MILKTIQLKKGEILQRKGDLNSKVYQVTSGLLRSYSIDEQGKEHIFMFAPENWIVADSRTKDSPADLFIDALEDSEVIVLEKQFTEAQNHQEKLLRRVSVLQKRVILLMSASAIERYESFVESYPEIVQRVPQRMIASYLGITPESLSRVKKEKYDSK
jgi:CRP-like cAMP-binding protein